MDTLFSHYAFFKKHFKLFYPIVPNEILDSVVNESLKDCPHMLFYGPEGSLKNDYIQAFITKHFGIDYLVNTQIIHSISSGHTKYDIPVNTTPYYMEFTPFELSAYDKNIISDIIKPIISQSSMGFERHIIIMKNAHELSNQAMMCLRRIMEIYQRNALFILSANKLGGIPEAIKSRCIAIRCPMLKKEQIYAIRDELQKHMPFSNDHDLVASCNRDVYQFLLSITNYELSKEISVDLEEADMKTFIDSLRKCRTPWSALTKIREFSYKLIHYQNDSRTIMTQLMSCLSTKYIKDQDRSAMFSEVIATADHQLCSSTRPNFVYENMFLNIFRIMIQ